MAPKSLITVVVLLGLTSCVLSEVTPAQVSVAAEQFAKADAYEFTRTLFAKMFKAYPEFERKFTKIYHPQCDSDPAFKAQVRATRDFILKTFKLGSEGKRDELKTELRNLATRHIGYGVLNEKFQLLKPIFREVVAETVPGADPIAFGAVLDSSIDAIKSDLFKTVADQWAACDQNNFVNVFFTKMFAKYPEYAKFFTKIDQPPNDNDKKFLLQKTKVKEMLNTAIVLGGQGSYAALTNALNSLGTRHIKYLVLNDMFQNIKPILMETVTEVISGADTTAFSAVLGYIVNEINTDMFSRAYTQWKDTNKNFFVKTFFKKMFKQFPKFQPFFTKFEYPQCDSDMEFKKQVNVTRDFLDNAFTLAGKGDYAGLNKAVRGLATRHIAYGVLNDKFQVLKPVFAETVAEAIPNADKEAFAAALGYMVDIFRTDVFEIAAKQWATTDKNAFTTKLFKKMFAAHPTYEGFFKNFAHPYSEGAADFQAQVAKTRDALDMAITGLGNGDYAGVSQKLEALATRHINYGVMNDKFQTLKPILATVVAESVPNADAEAFAATFEYILDSVRTPAFRTVRDQWARTNKDVFIKTFYKDMFTQFPAYEALFTKIAHPANFENPDAPFKEQLDKTRDMLGTAIDLLGNGKYGEAVAALKALGTRHVGYNVGQDKFQSIKPVINGVVAKVVPKADNAAWMAATGYIIDFIKP